MYVLVVAVVQSILGYLNPFVPEGVRISASMDNLTEIIIKIIHLAQPIRVLLALSVAPECFITSHQHQETMSKAG